MAGRLLLHPTRGHAAGHAALGQGDSPLQPHQIYIKFYLFCSLRMNWPTDPPTHRPTNPPTHRPTDPPTHRPTDPPTFRQQSWEEETEMLKLAVGHINRLRPRFVVVVRG